MEGVEHRRARKVPHTGSAALSIHFASPSCFRYLAMCLQQNLEARFCCAACATQSLTESRRAQVCMLA